MTPGVIRKATQAEPSLRIDANKMLSFLKQIKDNPEGDVPDLGPRNAETHEYGPGVHRVPPAVENVFAREPMQIMIAPESQLEALSIRGQNIPALPENEFRQAIPQFDVMEICREIPPSTMAKVAVRFLGIEMSQIAFARQKHWQNVEEANFDILNSWVQQNPGPDTRRQLYDILCEATRQGWIDRKVYSFLRE